MPAEFYKVLHIVGIVMVFVSLGALALHAANGGTRASNQARGLVAGTHGLGLLIVLVSGFGMAGKLGLMSGGMPAWILAKLGVWLLAGALLAVLMRMPQAARAVWLGLPVIGGLAAWLAIYKPF
jgi:hypothetical protein